MAEETSTKVPEPAPATEAVAVETVAVAVATEAPPPPAPVAEDPKKPPAEEAPPAPGAEEKKPEGEKAAVPESGSFKEESNVVGDLQDPEKKALDEIKQLVQAALANNEFTPPPPPPPPPAAPAPAEEPKAEEPAAPPAKSEPEEPPKPAEPEEPPKPAVAEEPAASAKVETPPPPPPAEEKAVVVEEDGAKTVEAIEETVVPVVPPATEEVTPAAEPEKEAPAEAAAAAPEEEVFIWGVPLVGDEKSDTILLKFLRARDFKAKDAMTMIKNAVIWRKQFGIDALLEEDLGLPELEKVVFMHGYDKEGHPVCYNVYGEFQNKELYDKAFGDEEKRQRFLKWRIQYLEKGIRSQLDFTPGGISSMVQVTDLRNSPKLGKHRQATKQALTMLQDNYPEFIAKKVFINVPWWYLAFNRMISPFFTQRTKSKFVFAGPSKSAETLFKYIAPEQVPVQYGGLSKDNDPDFTTSDAVAEVTIKPSFKQTVEIPVTEPCLVVWELRVLGWEVSYGAEFVPNAEDGYTVIVQKTRKLAATEEPVVKASFKVSEPGKVVLIVDNPTSKKKKLLYRSKAKSSTGSI
ncbi:patellin-3 isoform X2 [Elaeis guineensis]|uniref:Patellin-3 isoform X2 n=1 Tax=Elaeis guineensis var. tenera TaxID=51953 RepID=A0A6I9QKF5_ELAGV|nr:patellin-3 isoform X2 [Elaeis guineensis]